LARRCNQHLRTRGAWSRCMMMTNHHGSSVVLRLMFCVMSWCARLLGLKWRLVCVGGRGGAWALARRCNQHPRTRGSWSSCITMTKHLGVMYGV
jgi:hypothetical protein